MNLEIKDLHATVEGKEILKGVNLTVKQGETHALMGPNGSGKSTLAYTLMGHPRYQVTSGEILMGGENIVGMSPDKRARKGLFLAFQYPVAVQGVSMFSFLRAAYNAAHTKDPKEPPTIFEFREAVAEKLKMLSMDNRLPVILNTAYPSYKDNFMSWAAEAYVLKSADLSPLMKAVKSALGRPH
jgi:Fe-S cluster assembly ATP-binding protein